MAQSPPRPSASRSGGAAQSSSGRRGKDSDRPEGTFFLGRYRVVDEIGVGGMASVHLARMDGPGGFQKWVAIKRIHPHLVEDDQFVDMFLDEARIAAGINHANVAQVFDLGKDDNTYWIAMEYLHGEPLREVMRRAEERRLTITPELAARICADAAEGLHAAHELRGKGGQLLGLVHRDVTPHNLFITYDGYTKVVDFGIAKVADRLSSTRAGTLKGKLAYMSPEQVRGAEVDRTTDVFALGVVLWELTTGHRLFRMDTDLDTLEKVQACIVPPPSSMVADYPVELESVVMKALAKKKTDRYANARDFSRALQTYLMRAGIFVGPEEVATFVRDIFTDRIQKREAHLAWAAEVTSTINVDQLREGLPGAVDELSQESFESVDGAAPLKGASLPRVIPEAQGSGPGVGPPPQVPRAPGPTPVPAMASTSLLDDDEDVPTTVASREQMALPSRPAGGKMPPPRPAAGSPIDIAAPDSEDRTHAIPAPAGPYAQPSPPRGAGPAPHQFAGTVNMAEAPRLPPAPLAAPKFGPPPSAGAASAGAPPSGLAPSFGAPPMAPALSTPTPSGVSPAFGPGPAPPSAHGAPAGLSAPPRPDGGLPALPPAGPQPQSQIETALSLPRPDPASVWLAQQDAAGGGANRRNVWVLVAVGLLTALCVVGIGVLVYLKQSGETAPPSETQTAAPGETTQAPPASTDDPGGDGSKVQAGGDGAVADGGEDDGGDKIEILDADELAKEVDPKPTPGTDAGAPQAGSANEAEPGFLTIVCAPFCDDVLDNGRSLGPSPIVQVPVPPGQHRITLKRSGRPSKVITVIVVSGEVTAQRVTMK